MPLDPRAAEAANPALRDAARLADLERRVASLERADASVVLPQVESVTGPLRTGTGQLERSTRRLYFYVDGGLHYVALT